MPAPNQHQVWNDRIAAARDHFPELIDDDWMSALADYDLAGRMIRDLLSYGHAPTRRGHRVVPDQEEGLARWRDLIGDDWSPDPFPVALRALLGGRSLSHSARLTGISRSRLHRFLHGESQPTMEDIRVISAACGKRPIWFADYRVAFITAAIAAYLAADPERSAIYANRLDVALR